MEKIVIIADLGHFKAYSFSTTPQKTANLQLIDSYDTVEAHTRLSERITDSAGNFGEAGSMGWTKGSGEAHTLEKETGKRLVNNIISSIEFVLKNSKCSAWYLAASPRINSKILEGLAPEYKEHLKKNIKANLAKADKEEILKHLA
ncbi:MAG: host attachment protein [Nitrospiraceae bacterium]|nr:host attachment protein [Nitrospiraceae bacterium]